MQTKELRYFLESNNDYESKITTIKNHATTKQLQNWAVKVAESVLPLYEDKYPDDTGVRDCIQATKDYLAGTIGLNELESKRNTAYRAASATNAANSAAYAAYSAANAANSATYSATYSATSAAYSAAHAAYSAANAAYAASAAYAAGEKQKELNIKLMIEVLEIRVANTGITRKLYAKEIIRRTKDYIWI